jgi:hypothetical protein
MILALLACTPTVLVLGVDSGLVDSANPTGTDSDADTDVDADTDTDVDLSVDFSIWTGAREFAYDDCKGRLEETGDRLDEDWEQYFLVERYCPDCDHWYELNVGPETACGFTITQHTFRGLRLNDDDVEIFYMDVGGEDGGLLATGGWDEPNLVTYEYYIDTILLEGVIEFGYTSD